MPFQAKTLTYDDEVATNIVARKEKLKTSLRLSKTVVLVSRKIHQPYFAKASDED